MPQHLVMLGDIERIHTVDMLHAMVAGCIFWNPCHCAQLYGTAVSFISHTSVSSTWFRLSEVSMLHVGRLLSTVHKQKPGLVTQQVYEW